jgi:hypothetical protein
MPDSLLASMVFRRRPVTWLLAATHMRSRTYLSLLMILLPLAVLAHIETAGCLNNLHQLDVAKHMLEIERKMKSGDPVEPVMLGPYIHGGVVPQCPAGGKYTIGPIGVPPVCSMPGHSEVEFERDMERQARQDRFLRWLVGASGTVVATWVVLSVLAARRRARQAAHKVGPANRSQPSRLD